MQTQFHRRLPRRHRPRLQRLHLLHHLLKPCVLETGRRLVIKDAWVDESRECKEHDILEMLPDVKHVIEFLGQEEVDLGDSFHTTAMILDEFCPADRKSSQYLTGFQL